MTPLNTRAHFTKQIWYLECLWIRRLGKAVSMERGTHVGAQYIWQRHVMLTFTLPSRWCLRCKTGTSFCPRRPEHLRIHYSCRDPMLGKETFVKSCTFLLMKTPGGKLLILLQTPEYRFYKCSFCCDGIAFKEANWIHSVGRKKWRIIRCRYK